MKTNAASASIRPTLSSWSRLFTLTLALFLGAGASLCHAFPGTSRGEQFIATNFGEAMQRAGNALNARGYQINMGGTNRSFIAGGQGDYEAIIMCEGSDRPGQIVVNIIVAVSNGSGEAAGAEREELQRLMGTPAGKQQANVLNLAGAWVENNTSNCTIEQSGTTLRFSNYAGSSDGAFTSTLAITGWEQTAAVSADGRTITWANGNIWRR